MRFFKKLVLPFLLSLAFAHSAMAGDKYVLYDEQGHPAGSYEGILSQLRPEDTLDMGDSRTFVIRGDLGGGKVTRIFAIPDGWIIRVPAGTGSYDGKPYSEYLSGFLEAYRKIQFTGLMPEVDFQRSSSPRYLVVKEVTGIRFNLDDFLSKRPSDLKLTRKEHAELWKSLRRFARATWPIAAAGDMHTLQVVLSDGGWILMDLDLPLRLAKPGDQGTLFGRMAFLSPKAKKELGDQARSERRLREHLGWKGDFSHLESPECKRWLLPKEH